jgi:7-cyano-7-deazaguanine synthase in queuosine biosynthesis
MRKLSLYDLSKDFDNLMNADTDDEVTSALADIVAGEIEKKAESYCQFLKMLESTVETYKAEEKRISEGCKSIEKKIARAKERMKECLLLANIDKLDAGTFKISVGLTSGSVAIDDITKIPQKFLTVIPASFVPDKNAIKAAIKAKEEVPGAHIEANTALKIK